MRADEVADAARTKRTEKKKNSFFVLPLSAAHQRAQSVFVLSSPVMILITRHQQSALMTRMESKIGTANAKLSLTNKYASIASEVALRVTRSVTLTYLDFNVPFRTPLKNARISSKLVVCCPSAKIHAVRFRAFECERIEVFTGRNFAVGICRAIECKQCREMRSAQPKLGDPFVVMHCIDPREIKVAILSSELSQCPEEAASHVSTERSRVCAILRISFFGFRIDQRDQTESSNHKCFEVRLADLNKQRKMRMKRLRDFRNNRILIVINPLCDVLLMSHDQHKRTGIAACVACAYRDRFAIVVVNCTVLDHNETFAICTNAIIDDKRGRNGIRCNTVEQIDECLKSRRCSMMILFLHKRVITLVHPNVSTMRCMSTVSHCVCAVFLQRAWSACSSRQARIRLNHTKQEASRVEAQQGCETCAP
jgi:hypothetical protein